MQCFTHDIQFDKSLKIWDIFISFDENIKQIVATRNIKFYIHHPGQLFRTGLYPAVGGRRLKNLTLLRLEVQSLTVFRERKDGEIYCNSGNSDEDKIILENVAKEMNCSFIYPGTLIPSHTKYLV